MFSDLVATARLDSSSQAYHHFRTDAEVAATPLMHSVECYPYFLYLLLVSLSSNAVDYG